jgi:hypothetical protein
MVSGPALTEQFALPMLSLEASRTRLQRHPALLETLTQPLHLVVALRDNRRPSAQAVSHLLVSPEGTYPALRVERGAFCSSPAFTFLQMASVLDEEALLFLGMELCGRYGINAEGAVFYRPRICTSEQLSTLAKEMGRVRGRPRALAVAPQVIDNSASPMETALALILSRPVSCGGFGLPVPELNKDILVTGRARDLWDDDYITPDLLWEAIKLVIEYDSDLHHLTGHRQARDAVRRDVLAELGYRVVSVSAEHMRTPRALLRIADIVGHQCGLGPVSPTDDDWQRQVSFQLRMRDLAEHPEKLLGFSDEMPRRRKWSSRRVRA